MQVEIIRQPTIPANKDAMASRANLARDVMRPWVNAYDTWREGVEDVFTRAFGSKRSLYGCGCACEEDTCEQTSCQCSCCVADSDLVVEARAGEQRVVPIVIENKWRRKREIEVQLSDWSCGDSDLKVEGQIIEPLKFTLEPCSKHEMMLVIFVGGRSGARDTAANKTRIPENRESCVVCYADLRIKGCDVRPIRIAVAVLPSECGAFEIDCCQACC